MALKFTKAALRQSNGQVNYMVTWRLAEIRPCSWSRMVVFDGKVRAASDRASNSERQLKAAQHRQNSGQHGGGLERCHP